MRKCSNEEGLFAAGGWEANGRLPASRPSKVQLIQPAGVDARLPAAADLTRATACLLQARLLASDRQPCLVSHHKHHAIQALASHLHLQRGTNSHRGHDRRRHVRPTKGR